MLSCSVKPTCKPFIQNKFREILKKINYNTVSSGSTFKFCLKESLTLHEIIHMIMRFTCASILNSCKSIIILSNELFRFENNEAKVNLEMPFEPQNILLFNYYAHFVKQNNHTLQYNS